MLLQKLQTDSITWLQANTGDLWISKLKVREETGLWNSRCLYYKASWGKKPFATPSGFKKARYNPNPNPK